MAKQPGGYIPVDAADYEDKYKRVITPVTQRNRQRDQLLSKLPVSNKEYGNFAWDRDIPSYEPTVVKTKKAWKAREIQTEMERAERSGIPSPMMSNPNYAGHRQYRSEIERYRKSMSDSDPSPRGHNGHMPHYSYTNGSNHSNASHHSNASTAAPKPSITRDNVRVSDISRVDLVLHLNDRSTLVVRDVAYRPL